MSRLKLGSTFNAELHTFYYANFKGPNSIKDVTFFKSAAKLLVYQLSSYFTYRKYEVQKWEHEISIKKLRFSRAKHKPFFYKYPLTHQQKGKTDPKRFPNHPN